MYRLKPLDRITLNQPGLSEQAPMILKKILGDSVDEARRRGGRLYGEHVVVL